MHTDMHYTVIIPIFIRFVKRHLADPWRVRIRQAQRKKEKFRFTLDKQALFRYNVIKQKVMTGKRIFRDGITGPKRAAGW